MDSPDSMTPVLSGKLNPPLVPKQTPHPTYHNILQATLLPDTTSTCIQPEPKLHITIRNIFLFRYLHSTTQQRLYKRHCQRPEIQLHQHHTRPYLIRNRLATTTLSHRTTPNFTPDTPRTLTRRAVLSRANAPCGGRMEEQG